jgi:hypothetical protein
MGETLKSFDYRERFPVTRNLPVLPPSFPLDSPVRHARHSPRVQRDDESAGPIVVRPRTASYKGTKKEELGGDDEI